MIKSSLFAAGLISMVVSSASADVIAGWSMSTAVTATTAATYSYGAANSGTMRNLDESMLSGTHSSASTAWSSPAGNGSTYALSSTLGMLATTTKSPWRLLAIAPFQ